MNPENLKQLDLNINDNNQSEFKSIKIIEPIKKCIKTFKTTDEFNLWYIKNKNEIDSLTTHKLNKLYHIEGYRITKIKGELKLKKVNEKIKEDKFNEYHEEIDNIKNDIQKIKSTIKEIINYVNDMNNQIIK